MTEYIKFCTCNGEGCDGCDMDIIEEEVLLPHDIFYCGQCGLTPLSDFLTHDTQHTQKEK